ncbi:hypothetical protein [Seonamhaeicola marinus]|uniref:Alginate export domain-containing protein n=1 Tax=Seonamhaeicola marinus TaxID=1912246 RepID=A0A5D0I9U1_9FLAO|nr:hypothetical protein [Seonamhaeicola marinus]TYA78522.1 hypothetical protein FUA24_09200 [Seonamhaeicola marinus]
MKKQYALIAIFALVVQFAQAQFTLEGEFRPRAELFNNGFNYRYQPASASPAGNLSGREGSDAFVNTSVRVALNSKYVAEGYTLYLGVQEVFNFGDRTQIAASGNGNFRIQEAWADLKLSDKWSFKIGRQPLSYDDQRILGGLGWAQQARTHDVGLLRLKDNGFALDAGYSLNTNSGSGGPIFNRATLFTYKELAFVHANKKFGKVSLSGLILGTTFQAGSENKSTLITAGIHAKASLGKLGLAANAYIQDGQRVNDVEVKGASLLSLDATLKVGEKTSLLAGAEIISGTKDDSAAFFPLYGTNHKFNGLMDRFYVGNHAIGSGLVDINLGASFKLGGGYNLTVKGHTFKEESRAKNALGEEIDLVIAKAFNGYKLVAGYSQFFENDDFPNPAGNPEAKGTQNWAWAMLIIKPKFLNTAAKQ